MGNIQRGYFDISKVEYLAESEQPEREDIVNYGDFLFNTRNTLELVGKGATWMENSGKFAFNSNIARFELKDLNTIFFNYLYNTEDITKQIHARAVGTTSVAAIYPKTLESVEYFVPCIVEQEKIGNYFSNLDHLITLHQRKIYIFIKKLPIDWEQRKLGEIATETYGGGTPKTSNEEFWKGDIPWIQSSDLIDECLFDVRPRKCISQEAVSKSAAKLVPQNSIAIVTRVGVGKLAFMPFSYATSQDFLSLSGLKTDPEFTVYALYKMMQSVSNEVQGTSIKGVTKDELLAKKIIFPSCNEQKKIGAYLHNLDHLITLHHRECVILRKMKVNDWEQRKLGDLVNRVSRKNQDLVSELPLTISAQYGLIDQNEFFNKRVASKDVSGYYLIENGEFAYNKSTSTDAPWGTIKRLDRYENGVLSTLYIVFGIKENNPVDSDFLVSYYSTNLWHKGIHEIAAEGARNHGLLNISPMDFFETKLMIPQGIEEQKKIGKYFEELERLITLHHRECVILRKMKVNDWEQRKLKDILVRRVEQRKQSEEYPRLAFASGQGVIPLSERKTNNREQLTKDEFTKKYLVTELDDIVYNPANVKYGAIDRNKCGRGLISPIYVTFTTSEIPGFIERIVTSHDFQQRALRFEEGTVTKRQSVNPEDFVTIDILVATQKEEQSKISEYFDRLDHLITLHQHKCDELQNLKKYMLQNMFV